MTLAPILRAVCLILILAGPISLAAPASAQEQEFTPEAYTSVLSSFDIEVRGPVYEITGASLERYATGDGEIITIESEWVSIEVSFFDDSDSPEQTIDAYIAGIDNAEVDYVLVDRGELNGVTYAIVSLEYEGIEVLYYMQVSEDVTGNVDMLETVLTTADTFEDDLADAQEEISVNGMPLMERVNGTDLVDVVANGPASAATAEVEVRTEPVATSVPFDNAGVELEVGPGFTLSGEPFVDGDIYWYELAGDDTETVVAVGQSGMIAEDVVQEYVDSLDDYYDAVNPVDSSTSIDSAWALFTVELDGEERVLLVAVDTALVSGYELFVSMEMPADAVAASITSVQNGLSIDGTLLLAEIDADDIASRLDTGTPPSPTGTTGNSARDAAKLPEDTGSNNSSEVNSTPEPTEEPSGQSDSSWVG